MKLELVLLPVSDVDRALTFYSEQIGFHLDHDISPGNGMRIVQMTPTGSACSIGFGIGLGDPDRGAVKGMHLVVDDVAAARQLVIDNGVAISDVVDMGGILFAFFEDPDGNSWQFQEIPAEFRK